MAKIQPDQPLLPSVLDRLLDDDPAAIRDPPRSRHQILRELKQSVRRDLENLLNTRQRCLPVPAHLAELKQSLVNYGTPDFTAGSMGALKDRQDFARVLQAIITQYEPRFKSVKVALVDAAEPLDRTLRFRIDALLKADPAPEPVVFDSTFEPTTCSVEVRGVS